MTANPLKDQASLLVFRDSLEEKAGFSFEMGQACYISGVDE